MRYIYLFIVIFFSVLLFVFAQQKPLKKIAKTNLQFYRPATQQEIDSAFVRAFDFYDRDLIDRFIRNAFDSVAWAKNDSFVYFGGVDFKVDHINKKLLIPK